jgi:hypothetical protein
LISIRRNIDLISVHDFILVVIVTDIGSSSAISTSKTMKIIAIRKNRDENGSRAEFLGSNPHSKGDLFSRSSLFFFQIKVVRYITPFDTVIVVAVTVSIITNLFFTNFLIGSLYFTCIRYVVFYLPHL